MDIKIPYNEDLRPDTGLYNAKLGIWLFLASEIMLRWLFNCNGIILYIGHWNFLTSTVIFITVQEGPSSSYYI